MTKEEILQVAEWRSAIKQFDSKREIHDSDWQFLLEIARLAPSSYGFEPWNLLIVGNDMRQKLMPAMSDSNKDRLQASKFVIFTVKNDLAPESKYFQSIMKEHGMNAVLRLAYQLSFKIFQNKAQDLTDARKRHDWAAKQAYIAFAQMIFAAAEIGIDSCPIEGFDKSYAEQILSENGAIDLGTDSLALMAAFGYRAKDPLPKKRRLLNEIVRTV